MKDTKKKPLWQQMGRKTPDMVSPEMKLQKKKKEDQEDSEKSDLWRRTHVFRKK